MFEQIKESDWKILRKLHPIALERYCKHVIEELNRTTSNRKQDYHKCYLKVWDILGKRDRKMTKLFDDLKRSNALILLANIKGSNLLTDEEFSQFSEETQERIALILNLRRL